MRPGILFATLMLCCAAPWLSTASGADVSSSSSGPAAPSLDQLSLPSSSRFT